MSTTKLFPSDQSNNETWLDLTCYPTFFDIISLKRLFLSHSLPNELMDVIFDLAEYWPYSSRSLPSPIKAQPEIQWRDRRGTHRLPSFKTASKDGPILSSPPLGLPPLNVLQSHALLVPSTRHPVRMVIFEIRYRRDFTLNPKWRRPQIVRQTSTRLEIDIKRPTESSPSSDLEPDVWLKDHVDDSSLLLQQICDHIHTSWQSKRSLYDRAHTKIDLYMDHSVLADDMTGQKTVVWKYDDSENYLDDGWDLSRKTMGGLSEAYDSDDYLDNGWDLSGEIMRLLSEADKAHVNDYVHSLAKEDRREQANFLKQLEEGDSLGVWAKARSGPDVSMIEGMRMHVFWAAS